MTEQAIQRKIIEYLESQCYYVIKVVSANKSGVPDIIACSPSGRFVAIEVKRPESIKTVTKLQRYNLQQIENKGGISFVATSVQDVKDRLQEAA